MVQDEPDFMEDVLPAIIQFRLGIGARALRHHDDPLPLVVFQESFKGSGLRGLVSVSSSLDGVRLADPFTGVPLPIP
jgi:hypothetical protein